MPKIFEIFKYSIIIVDTLVGSPLQRTIYKFKYLKSKKIINQQYKHKFIVRRSNINENVFATLCDLYGSDKGSNNPFNNKHPWPSHTYSDFYDFYFYKHRKNYQNILECGIGTNNIIYSSNMSSRGVPGASLRVLRDYFSQAIIYGIDIDQTVLFEEDRIKTFQVDQTDPLSISLFKKNIEKTRFDLVIDDGLHTFDSSITLFENIKECLNENFDYIIEDVYAIDLGRYVEYFKKENLSIQIIELFRQKKLHKKMGDNNLVCISNHYSY
jgi:hypothetical protein